MRARHLLLTLAVSFAGAFCAVLVLCKGAFPLGIAACPGPKGTPCGNGDVNASGAIDIADAIYLLTYLFNHGPQPIAWADGGLTPQQAEILSHFSMVDLPDGQGGTARTIRISGVNLQLVNGMGATNGKPNEPLNVEVYDKNGLGNLIIGYDERQSQDRTGSHNLVVGPLHAYSSVGGIVGGNRNSITGQYASVTGGALNEAIGDSASISGGQSNKARGYATSISGGHTNTASGAFSSITGGMSGTATGGAATVSGGSSNSAAGDSSTVSGGCSRSTTRDCEHAP